MTAISDFGDVHEALKPYLSHQPLIHEAYTLERMRLLMTALDNPQDKLKIVHVAGTSGKTSTSYYVSALLQQAGQRVGLTVSPHLAEVNERLQINLIPLAETLYCQALSEFLDLVTKTKIVPTYYELLIAFPYWYFAQQKVDYAIIEVGLGGLFDSTNVCTRADKVCVITDIGLDHTQILGTDLPSITAQKAGIIQSGNTVICFKQSKEVDAVIERQTHYKQGRLQTYKYKPMPLTKLPLFQQRNWQLAAHVYTYTQQRDLLPELLFEQWQQTQLTYIPGRMEIIIIGSKTIVLDGAHNPQKMQTLVESLTTQYPRTAVAALVAIKASKDLGSTIDPILRVSKRLIATEFGSNYGPLYRSISADEIRKFDKDKIEAIPELSVAVMTLLKRPEPLLVITGSLYLLQAVKNLLVK